MRQDRRQHAFFVVEDGIVVEADHTDAVRQQCAGALTISLADDVVVVVLTVELDAEPSFSAIEIQNEAIDSVLPAKAKAAQPAAANTLPQTLLCRRCLPT